MNADVQSFVPGLRALSATDWEMLATLKRRRYVASSGLFLNAATARGVNTTFQNPAASGKFAYITNVVYYVVSQTGAGLPANEIQYILTPTVNLPATVLVSRNKMLGGANGTVVVKNDNPAGLGLGGGTLILSTDMHGHVLAQPVGVAAPYGTEYNYSLGWGVPENTLFGWWFATSVNYTTFYVEVHWTEVDVF